METTEHQKMVTAMRKLLQSILIFKQNKYFIDMFILLIFAQISHSNTYFFGIFQPINSG